MVHATHIIAVAALITNPEGRALLIKNPERGWEIPGGQVEEGEDLISALEREIMEETGVTASIGPLIGVYSRIKPPYMFLFTFKAEWISGDLKTSPESEAVEWVRTDNLLSRIAHPAIYDRVKDLLENENGIVYCVYSTNPYRTYKKPNN